MTYATTNGPQQLAGNKKFHLWYYQSADSHGTVEGAGYFTNGKLLGMVVGDVVLVIDTNTPTAVICYVASFTGNAANLTAATLA